MPPILENNLDAQEGKESRHPDAKAVHDINNLMGTIVGALELVRKLIGNGRVAETERFIASAIAAAHRAAELNQQRVAPAAPAGEPVERKTESP